MSTLKKINQQIAQQIRIVQNIMQQKNKPHTIHTTSHNSHEPPPFEKILIANRGEIACRIIKTARKMRIKTVAVYSTADATSKHVKLADEAVFIGPSLSKHSYLDMAKILDAVTSTRAQAVHPGYGFLAENPAFVELLENNNITFIGPSAKSMAGMGDKLESKRLAMAAGVNTISGYDGIIIDADECVEIAKNIGYPVIIKASAGGGGKGMRIAANDKAVRESFKLATQEAEASFGDGRILIEKFIDDARHIEIQVLGDKYGNVVHLNERECSIQRRNQKIIEEAPSSFLTETTRKAMGDQAVTLCKKLGYYSAGTVEFLLDKHSNFYFLEMNTRLQVEHPVTETITGIDLVYQMINIAKGHPLDIKQDDVKINGWAIESRVYAEDPYKNFGLPSTGQVYKYREPCSDGVRCDSGVEEGSVIGIYYDPMICKLICSGKNRQEAIERSVRALDSYVIYGVKNNIALLRDVLTEDKFNKGDVSTKYLTEVYPDGFRGGSLDQKGANTIMLIALAVYGAKELRNGQYLNSTSLKVQREWNVVVFFKGEKTSAKISHDKNDFYVEIEDEVFKINKDISLSNPILDIKINKESVLAQLMSKNSTGEIQLIYHGTNYKLTILSKIAADLLSLIPKKPKIDGSKFIKSPMPGLVKNIVCKVGDDVEEGQQLCIVEAMKMQNSMISIRTGRVKRVYVNEGDAVGNDDVLVQLE